MCGTAATAILVDEPDLPGLTLDNHMRHAQHEEGPFRGLCI
jgi:hypothetical protein